MNEHPCLTITCGGMRHSRRPSGRSTTLATPATYHPRPSLSRAGGRFFGTTPVSELLAWLDEPEQGAGRDHWLSAFRAGALPMLRAEHAVETIGNLVDATCTASGTNTWDCTAYDTPATNSAIVSGREEVERTVRLRAGSFSVERSL